MSAFLIMNAADMIDMKIEDGKHVGSFPVSQFLAPIISKLNLEALIQKNRLDLAAAKGELMQVDPLASLLTKPGVEIGDGSSTVVAVDEDGEISPNTDMVLLNQQQFQNEDNKIHNNN